MSCVRATSAMTTRHARAQKSSGSHSSRLVRRKREVTVMEESPKRVTVRPGRPGADSVVRGLPSLSRGSRAEERIER